METRGGLYWTRGAFCRLGGRELEKQSVISLFAQVDVSGDSQHRSKSPIPLRSLLRGAGGALQARRNSHFLSSQYCARYRRQR